MKGQFYFLNENLQVQEVNPINKLKYKEELIIKKSVEMFDDEDPCIIHRTWATNQISVELLDEINKKYKNENELLFEINELPDFIKSKIEITNNYKYIKIL